VLGTETVTAALRHLKGNQTYLQTSSCH